MKKTFSAFATGVVLATALVYSYSEANAAPRMNLADAGRLPQKMQMHGTAVIGNRMYVFGGDLAGGSNATLWTSQVNSALIDTANATFGEWRQEQSLPDMRAYMNNCVEVVNDRIYIVGGIVATQATVESATRRVNTVTWTKVTPDGRLEPWRLSAPFPGDPLLLGATCATDDHLLLLGGLATEGKREVFAAEFSPEGEPVNWKQIGSLPETLYNHGAAILGDRIYVWGGMHAAARLNSRVWSAQFNNGQLGQWRDEQPMPQAIYGAPACGINDYLVSVGGRRQGGLNSKDIWFARLDNGRVNNWQQVETNLEATFFHNISLLKDNGWVFATGGQHRSSPSAEPTISNNVQAFKIPAAGGAGGIGAGLPTIDTALQQAKSSGKKALVFFYSPAVPACQRLWDNVISTPDFKSRTSNHVVGVVDTSQKDTTWSYKLGVFRVPCLVELDADGNLLRRSPGLNSAQDVTEFLSGT